MKPETLYENLNSVDEQLLERSETAKAPRRRPWWMGAVAAALVAVVALGAAFWPKGSPLGVEAHAIETAAYPEMAPYPDEADYVDQATGEYDNEGFNQAHDAWWESKQALLPEEGYADGLDSFFQKSIPVFLGGKEGENAAYSPVNVYMALAMLAELTDGASRQQILDLLGSDSLEALRQQAQAVWRAQYQNDGATTTILASSVWLDEDISYNQETMQTLAESYYASSYQGQMGSEEYSQLLREWLNDQTGGLLEEQVESVEMKPEDVLALATTLYYKARWADEFSPENTSPQTFHAPSGDVEVDFMHQTMEESYYQGENFGVVRKGLQNSGAMWLILPDEGTTPEQLLEQGDALEPLLAEYNWEDWETRTVHLSLPKFDVVSETDLLDGLEALGVTDVMDPAASDFSPLTSEIKGLYLSSAQHAVRVTTDEEGVEAAAYTVFSLSATSAEEMPEELDFVLDRPFLFAITSQDGLPLFVGAVNHP